MPSRDEVRIVIAGKEYSGWTGVTIDTAIDQIADAFSVSAPYDPKALAALKPFGYDRVEVYVGTDLVLTGTIDRIDAGLAAGGNTITVQGRSLPGALVDNAIDGPLEYSGLSLSTIARQIAKPFGVMIRADNDTNPLDLARAEYGQTAADFLNSLAAPRLLLLNSSPSGQLVITWGRAIKDRPVIASIVEGETPMSSLSASFDGTRRHSVYKAASQFAGEPDIVGRVTDSAIRAYRPHLVSVGETDQDPAVTARRLRAEADAASLGISATLPGWRRPDGALWASGHVITLRAPSVILRAAASYIIAGRRLSLDEGGQSAELRLTLPETYAGEPAKDTPWA